MSCELRVETTSRVSLPFLLDAGYSQRVESPKRRIKWLPWQSLYFLLTYLPQWAS